MTLTSFIEMHQGPPSHWVLLRYYGGPWDGETRGNMVRASDLKGSLRLRRGHYSLQGFRSSGVTGVLKEFAIDYAIYEWVTE